MPTTRNVFPKKPRVLNRCCEGPVIVMEPEHDHMLCLGAFAEALKEAAQGSMSVRLLQECGSWCWGIRRICRSEA